MRAGPCGAVLRLVVAGLVRRSGRGGERGEAGECGGQLAGPRPGAGDAQAGLAGVKGQACGGVQEAVAQGPWLADGKVAVEREVLGPADQVAGGQAELEPD